MMIDGRSRSNRVKARSRRAEVKKASEQLEKATSVLKAINEAAKKFAQLIRQLLISFTFLLDELEATIAVAGKDYTRYCECQKRQIHLAVQFAQVLALLLKTPLLSKEGAFDQNCTKALQQGQLLLNY